MRAKVCLVWIGVVFLALLFSVIPVSAEVARMNGTSYYRSWNSSAMVGDNEFNLSDPDKYPYRFVDDNPDFWLFYKDRDVLKLPKNLVDVVYTYPHQISFEIQTTKAQVQNKSEPNGTGMRYIVIPEPLLKTKFWFDNRKPAVLIDNGTAQWYANESTYWYSRNNGSTRFNFLTEPYLELNATDNITFVFRSYTVFNGETRTTEYLANSSGYGYRQTLTGENLFNSSVSLSQITSPWTALSSAELDGLSATDGTTVAQTGSSTKDAIIFVNFSIPDVYSISDVDSVRLAVNLSATTNAETLVMGLYNYGGSWVKVNSSKPAAINTFVPLTYTLDASNRDTYLRVDANNNLNFSVAVWINGTANAGVIVDLIDPIITFSGSTSPAWQNSSFNNTTNVQATKNIELQQSINDYVSYWRFDEGSGTSTKNENTTNVNTGSFVGNTAWNLTSKMYGNSAVSFDGADDYINVPTGNSLNITGSITITAWVRLEQTGVWQAIVTKGSEDTYQARISSVNRPSFKVYQDATTSAILTPTVFPLLTTGTWYFFGFGYNGTHLIVYQDGGMTTLSTTITSIEKEAYSLKIGIRDDLVNDFKGVIDDVRIYNRSLSWDEVNQTRLNTKYTLGNSTHWDTFADGRQGRRAMANFSGTGTLDLYSSADNISFSLVQTGVSNATWSNDFPASTKSQTQYVRYVYNGNGTTSPEMLEVSIEDEAAVVGNPPAITSWSNNKTSNATLTFTVNTSESVNFNATANQTVTTWKWAVNGSDQSINFDNWTTSWSTAGLRNVSVNATNSNGTSNTVYWNVTVQSLGGQAYSYRLDESIGVSDGLRKQGAFKLALAQGFGISDNIYKQGNFKLSLAQELGISDSLYKRGTFSLHLSDGINIAEGIKKSSTFTLKLSEFLAMQDSLKTYRGIILRLSEAIGITDSLKKRSGSLKKLSESLSLSDSLKKNSSFTIQLSQGITIIDLPRIVLPLGQYSLVGYIYNVLDRPIENARVNVSTSYNFTNSLGYFTISNITQGTYNVLARAIGYRNSTNTTTISSDTDMNFTLEERRQGTVSTPMLGIVGNIFILLAVIYLMRRMRS